MAREDDDDLERVMDTFVADAARRVRAVEARLLTIDKAPDAAASDAVAMDLHTLKGDAALVRLSALSALVHRGEDLVSALADPGSRRRDAVSVLLRLVDHVAGTVDAVKRRLPPPEPPAALHEALDVHAGLTAQGRPASDPRGGAAEEAPAPRADVDVDLARLDQLIATVGDLEVAWVHLRRALGEGGATSERASWQLDAVEALHKQLKDVTVELRMVSIDPLVQRLERAVRDLSLSLGKEVALELSVERVRVDVQLREGLKAPLLHLVRNAIDHGLEPPDERERNGKPRRGVVRVAVRARAGYLALDVEDDGAGIAVDRLRAEAARVGVDPRGLGEQALLGLVFKPGLSTKGELTELSGRGVGLSVVESALAALGGSVQVESTPGVGTTFRLRAPLSSLLFEGLMFHAASQRWAVYMDQVEACVPFEAAKARFGPNATGLFELGDGVLPFLDLGAFSGRAGHTEVGSMIVLRDGERRSGILTDTIVGTNRLVLRPSDAVLRAARFVAGTALLPDASVGLVLDPVELGRALVGLTGSPERGLA